MGKSTLAAALAAYWQIYFSERTIDVLTLTPEQFAPGAAPDTASSQETSSTSVPRRTWLDLAQAWQQLTQLSSPMVLMELPGGLGTPLTPEVTVADLAWDWRLPTVLVVPAASDLVEQAIAHVSLARQARVHLKGIVINHTSPPRSNASAESLGHSSSLREALALIQSFTQIPLLGEIPYLPDPEDASALAAAASNLELERLFPLSMLLSPS